jgi:hypothetical protein
LSIPASTETEDQRGEDHQQEKGKPSILKCNLQKKIKVYIEDTVKSMAVKQKISGTNELADFDKVWFFYVPATKTPSQNQKHYEKPSVKNKSTSSHISSADESRKSKQCTVKT